jgi:putative transposase
MPYEYRKLNPEEQRAVVEQRRQRGYPFHAPPHPYREAGWYFLTAVNYAHQPIMHTVERRDGFETRLLEALFSIEAQIGGWVILPNHYHILAGVDSLDTVSSLLQHLHGSTAREWNLADALTGKRRVWYRFRDRGIRDERHYYQALNYIHYNPVKHHCVSDPYAWAWSSILFYEDTKGRAWLKEKWTEYPPGSFGAGWDDEAN